VLDLFPTTLKRKKGVEEKAYGEEGNITGGEEVRASASGSLDGKNFQCGET